MVNDGQSFNQYKDKSHAMSTESIQRIIGSETYQAKLVQTWVDSIGQDIVNKLRVRESMELLRLSFSIGSVG